MILIDKQQGFDLLKKSDLEEKIVRNPKAGIPKFDHKLCTFISENQAIHKIEA